jgi:hypothetical protein
MDGWMDGWMGVKAVLKDCLVQSKNFSVGDVGANLDDQIDKSRQFFL